MQNKKITFCKHWKDCKIKKLINTAMQWKIKIDKYNQCNNKMCKKINNTHHDKNYAKYKTNFLTPKRQQ